MSASSNHHPTPAQFEAAIELLEKAARNRALLAGLSEAEHTRLMKAAGDLYCPDVDAAPPAREGQGETAQGAKHPAGPVQAQPDRHPQIAPAKKFSPRRMCFRRPISSKWKSTDNPDFHEVGRAAELLRLQTGLFADPPFLRPALPGVRGIEFPQAQRTGGPARARGAAHRRPRENRLSGGHQTAALRRATHCDHALSARLGDALRARSRISRIGDIGWKFSGSTCGTRRAWRRFAGICWPHIRGWISSSTTPARPCGVRRIFTRT